MPYALEFLANRQPHVVGSFGSQAAIAAATPAGVRAACDLAEVRLDLLEARDSSPWQHLAAVPLLFTARRPAEGGAGDMDDATRTHLLERALGDAACIDIEVASIGGMAKLLDSLTSRGLPWIASFHDFTGLPAASVLESAAAQALAAGAAVFKVAALMREPADVARLAEFQLVDHGLPVATMGMGALAPVSRLLCAQCGSVLNYGYLGDAPTAPGQWDAAMLKHAIARLQRIC